MATFNGESFISQQLDSFIHQTRQPDEVVVCDDGSSDSTVAILREYSNKAPFDIKIFRNRQNIGYVKNFERAVSFCSGDIIFLSDQDDIWLPKKIEHCVNIFLRRPHVFLVRSNMRLYTGNNDEKNLTQLGNIRALGLSDDNFYTGCGLAFRREIASLAHPFPDVAFGHDRWLFDLAHVLGRDYLEPTPLMDYRRHQDNESQWVASNVEPLNKWDSIRTHGLTDATPAWSKEVESLEKIRERMAVRESILKEFCSESDLCSAHAYVDRKISNHKNRLAVVAIPRWRRSVSVALLWANGCYKDFSGWKSAVKDVIRP